MQTLKKKGLGGNGSGTYMYRTTRHIQLKVLGTNVYQQTYAGKRIYLQNENLLTYYLQ